MEHEKDIDGMRIEAKFLLRLIKEKDIAEGRQQIIITSNGKPVSNDDAVKFIEDAINMGIKYLPEAFEDRAIREAICKGKANHVTGAALARKFSVLLNEDIGDAAMIELVGNNKAEADETICHSHDFCDANMIMAEALQSFGVAEDPIIETENYVSLWNEAWAIAQANDFYIQERG